MLSWWVYSAASVRSSRIASSANLALKSTLKRYLVGFTPVHPTDREQPNALSVFLGPSHCGKCGLSGNYPKADIQRPRCKWLQCRNCRMSASRSHPCRSWSPAPSPEAAIHRGQAAVRGNQRDWDIADIPPGLGNVGFHHERTYTQALWRHGRMAWVGPISMLLAIRRVLRGPIHLHCDL